MTEANPTGIIWARVSTAEQELGYSLDAQVDRLKKAAVQPPNKRPPIHVVETFKVHETGSRSARRKHFRSMVEFVRTHNVDFIIAYKIDRLARNWRDSHTLQDLIEKGVSVFIEADNRIYDNDSSSSDRFHFRTMGNVAQLEAEQIGERTALGMKAKLKSGQITWEAPIGYLNVEDPDDPSHRRRTVVVDEKRAPHVQWAYERYATGKVPVSALTDQLNDRGLRSKPNKKGETFPITRRTVEVMLHNRFYIGEFVDRKAKELRRHNYPRLVEPSLWLAVQQRLKENNRNTKGRRDKERFFFKPFLKCGYCGAQITAYSPKPGQVYYDCTQSHVKKNGKKRCAESIIYPEAKIEAMFTQAVSLICINDTIATRLKNYLAEEHKERTASSARRRRALAVTFSIFCCTAGASRRSPGPDRPAS